MTQRFSQTANGTRHTARCAGALAVLITLTACADREHYKSGVTYMDEGRFDDALVAFDAALEINPDKTKYLDARNEAKNASTDFHNRKAEEFIGDHRATDAMVEIDTVLAHTPNDPRARQLREQAQVDIARCLEEVNASNELLSQRQWDSAIERARAARRIDGSHLAARRAHADAITATVDHHLDQAERHLDDRDWNACRTSCDRARKWDAGNTREKRLRTLADDREQAQRLVAEARVFVDTDQVEHAVEDLERAERLWPENSEIHSALRVARGKAADKSVAAAETALGQGDNEQAVEFLEGALALRADHQPATALLRDAFAAWRNDLIQKAEDWADRGEWERSWAVAIEAAILPGPSGQNDDAIDMCFRAEQQLRRRLRYTVAVRPIMNRSDEARAEVQDVARFVAAKLWEAKPEHVAMPERYNLQPIFDEIDLSLAGVTDPRLAQVTQQAKPEGVDRILLLNVHSAVRGEQRPGKRVTKRYVVGAEYRENPDYARAMRKRDRREDDYRDAVEDFEEYRREMRPKRMREAREDMAEAKRDLDEAQRNLEATPPQISRKIWKEYTFNEEQVGRIAAVHVSMRLVDVVTQSWMWAVQTIRAEASAWDKRWPAHPGARVEERIANLPSNNELRAQAVEQLKPKLARRIREMFSEDAAEALKNARRLRSDASVYYVRYLFGAGPKADPAAVTEAAKAIWRRQQGDNRWEACRRLAQQRLARD